MKPANDLPDLLSAVERTATDLADTAMYAEQYDFLYGGLDTVGVSQLTSLVDVHVNPAPTTARPVVGPAVQYAKAAVKRATQWYVDPLATKATNFNRSAAGVLVSLAERVARIESAQRDDRRKVRTLETRVASLESALAAALARVPAEPDASATPDATGPEATKPAPDAEVPSA